jgi:hypothetical protein
MKRVASPTLRCLPDRQNMSMDVSVSPRLRHQGATLEQGEARTHAEIQDTRTHIF